MSKGTKILIIVVVILIILYFVTKPKTTTAQPVTLGSLWQSIKTTLKI